MIRNTFTTLAAIPLWVLAAVLLTGMPASATAQQLPDTDQCRDLWSGGSPIKPVIEGWCLIIDPHKGNCLACHHIETPYRPDSLGRAGNAGPVLANLGETWKDRNELAAVIYDIRESRPDAFMPPYGRNGILTDKQIDLVVKYLLSF